MAARKKTSTKRASRKPPSGAKKKSTKTKIDLPRALRVELARVFRRGDGASEILADLLPAERACPSKAASVGVFGLPNLADASGELRSAGLFGVVRTETDAQDGGLVETQTSTTRLMRLGNGFVRCYVTGGTAEQRLVVCRSLAPAR